MPEACGHGRAGGGGGDAGRAAAMQGGRWRCRAGGGGGDAGRRRADLPLDHEPMHRLHQLDEVRQRAREHLAPVVAGNQLGRVRVDREQVEHLSLSAGGLGGLGGHQLLERGDADVTRRRPPPPAASRRAPRRPARLAAALLGFNQVGDGVGGDGAAHGGETLAHADVLLPYLLPLAGRVHELHPRLLVGAQRHDPVLVRLALARVVRERPLLQ